MPEPSYTIDIDTLISHFADQPLDIVEPEPEPVLPNRRSAAERALELAQERTSLQTKLAEVERELKRCVEEARAELTGLLKLLADLA